MNSLHDRVSAYMKRTGQGAAGQRILLGVSGGIDSIVLLDVLHALEYECEVVHVNFQLRGSESDEDEKFVAEACAQRGVEFHVHQAPARSHATQTKTSTQMAARELRYDLFAKTAAQRQISAVAVGHHSDDQSESLLINLNRGTGPEGIAGMCPRRFLDDRVTLIRPLLAENRASIREYAEAKELSWREDLSNQDETYLRSRIRLNVMPHLNSQALARSANLVGKWVDQVIHPMIEEHFATASEGQSLAITYLKELPDVLAHRLVIEGLRNWMPNAPADETLAEKVMALIDVQPGKRIEVGGGAIWQDRNHLTFTASIADKSMQGSQSFTDSSPITVPGGKLRLYLTEAEPAQLCNPNEVWFDAEKLTLPLTVRSWLPGDRIHPLGMRGTKKVSDLLTDVAVPASRRSNVTVVCSGEMIVWIVGYRMSHQFRITKSTRKYARLCFEQN